jgi:N-acetylmuramoyl-L-alanine amidase
MNVRMLSIAILCQSLAASSYEEYGLKITTAPALPNNYTISKTIDTPPLLVLHYTVYDLPTTLKIFTGENEKNVSAHYTISEKGDLFKHVDEQNSAHHAGESYWRNQEKMHQPSGIKKLNHCSIGIEHVNPGFKERPEQPQGITITGSSREWYPFSKEQMATSLQLFLGLIKKYNIDPRNVVGHSDIAPGRKQDPGPLFPWEKFADQGIGAWPDKDRSWKKLNCAKKLRPQDLTEWVVHHLHMWGYRKPYNAKTAQPNEYKATAEDIIQSFHMHFRPTNISQTADSETVIILNNLLRKYYFPTSTRCTCIKQ